jgi:CheY-like chemotaxis protein
LALKKIIEDVGYVVLDAANGAAGLEIMRTSQVDLAIVDLEMPVMDGMEFTKWVKEISPKFPVVIVTAHANHFSPVEILSANIEALLQKPFKVDELLKLLDQF